MTNHYDFAMGYDVALDVHCEITTSNDDARDIRCDVTMHNDVHMNLFYYVLFSMPNCVILLWIVWYGIKTRTSLCLISNGWRTQSLFLCRAI